MGAAVVRMSGATNSSLVRFKGPSTGENSSLGLETCQELVARESINLQEEPTTAGGPGFNGGGGGVWRISVWALMELAR